MKTDKVASFFFYVLNALSIIQTKHTEAANSQRCHWENKKWSFATQGTQHTTRDRYNATISTTHGDSCEKNERQSRLRPNTGVRNWTALM